MTDDKIVVTVMRLFQIAKDIEAAENMLDDVCSKTDTGALCSDPEQLMAKIAEQEVGIPVEAHMHY